MTQRERTIAIVTGSVVGIAVLYSVVLDPLLTRLDEAQSLVDTNRAELDAADSLQERQRRDSREWRQIAGGRVSNDESTAESQLLNRIGEAARRAGLKIETSQGRSADSERGFGRIQRSVSALGNMSQISRFLYALQTSDIPLRVIDLNITSKKDGSDELQLSMNVATLINAPAAPARVAGRSPGRREVLQ